MKRYFEEQLKNAVPFTEEMRQQKKAKFGKEEPVDRIGKKMLFYMFEQWDLQTDDGVKNLIEIKSTWEDTLEADLAGKTYIDEGHKGLPRFADERATERYRRAHVI